MTCEQKIVDLIDQEHFIVELICFAYGNLYYGNFSVMTFFVINYSSHKVVKK